MEALLALGARHFWSIPTGFTLERGQRPAAAAVLSGSMRDRLRMWLANPRTAFRPFLIASIARQPGHAAMAVPVLLSSRLAAIVRVALRVVRGGCIFANNARGRNMTRRFATMIAGRTPGPYRRYAIYERTLDE